MGSGSAEACSGRARAASTDPAARHARVLREGLGDERRGQGPRLRGSLVASRRLLGRTSSLPDRGLTATCTPGHNRQEDDGSNGHHHLTCGRTHGLAGERDAAHRTVPWTLARASAARGHTSPARDGIRCAGRWVEGTERPGRRDRASGAGGGGRGSGEGRSGLLGRAVERKRPGKPALRRGGPLVAAGVVREADPAGDAQHACPLVRRGRGSGAQPHGAGRAATRAAGQHRGERPKHRGHTLHGTTAPRGVKPGASRLIAPAPRAVPAPARPPPGPVLARGDRAANARSGRARGTRSPAPAPGPRSRGAAGPAWPRP
jgi:hypothetical protein